MKNLLVAIMAVALVSAVLLVLRAAPVEAQVDCEEVTYNGRLVTNCTASTGETVTPTPVPRPTTTSSSGGSSGNSGDGASTDNAGEDGQVDRGNRGGRRGIELYDVEEEPEAQEPTAADEPDASQADGPQDEDASGDDAEQSEDAMDDTDASESETTESATTSSTVADDDSGSSNALLLFGLAALMVIGALFLWASTRSRRKEIDVAPIASISDVDQKIQE